MMTGMPTCTVASTYVFPGIYQEKITIQSNRNTGSMVFTRLSNAYPLVKGGQGRTRQAIKNGVEIWGWIMLACVLAALAILATPGCCKPNLNKPTDIIGN